MIQFPESIGDAYVVPARNVAMPSMPGRTVKFLQGHAVIKDGRDMVAMLKRRDVKVVLTPYAASWMETWFHQAGEVQAEVLMPEPPPRGRPQGWEPPKEPPPDASDSTEPDS